jgi:serine/threonine protein kinase
MEPRWLGKYELRELLGRGGLAEVWKARDTQLQRYVAIKLLHADLQNDPEFLKRFEREARMVASLHHPNIVQVHDFQMVRLSESGGLIAYMVMEYIGGPTLAQYIAQTSGTRQFPAPDQILQLFASLGSAIDYAHRRNMVHRDIKPTNILLDQSNTIHNSMGEPILTDFGIARVLNNSSGMQSGWWRGAELYMSPEQARGHPGDERSDIYSSGVILYEMCTGVQPFRGETPAAIMQQHIHMMPVSPLALNPALPPAIAMVLLHCLAKQPEMRYADAASMVAALADGFTLPMPDTLNQVSIPLVQMDELATHLPPSPALAQNMISPVAVVQPVNQTPLPSSYPLLSTQVTGGTLAEQRQITPVTPAPPFITSGITPGVWSRDAWQHPAGNAAPPFAAAPPLEPTRLTPPPVQKRRGRVAPIILMLVALLLVGAGVGSYFVLSNQASTPPITRPNPLVGHAFFVSSGQLAASGNQSINDELQINLSGIADPAPGKSYYAWLLKDKSIPDATALLLGEIVVAHGSAHLLYPGDAQHTNLLDITSRVLITQEDANIVPVNPSPDQSTWRYYAELPQTSNPSDMVNHFSLLDHLRDLLAEDPQIAASGFHGGLSFWLARNVEKLLEWAGSARDYWGEAGSTTLMRNQFIRILDYIDGQANVQADVPPGTPLLINAPVALLNPALSTSQNARGVDYVHEIIGHLNAIAQAPGVTPDDRALTAQINTGLNNLTSWLNQLRRDAKQLLSMTNAQLLQPSALPLLDDLQINAFYAYVGQLDPGTNQIQDGTTQIYDETERLATFDISAFKAV